MSRYTGKGGPGVQGTGTPCWYCDARNSATRTAAVAHARMISSERLGTSIKWGFALAALVASTSTAAPHGLAPLQHLLDRKLMSTT